MIRKKTSVNCTLAIDGLLCSAESVKVTNNLLTNMNLRAKKLIDFPSVKR